jgi:hypothetical protein
VFRGDDPASNGSTNIKEYQFGCQAKMAVGKKLQITIGKKGIYNKFTTIVILEIYRYQ